MCQPLTGENHKSFFLFCHFSDDECDIFRVLNIFSAGPMTHLIRSLRDPLYLIIPYVCMYRVRIILHDDDKKGDASLFVFKLKKPKSFSMAT